MRYPFQWALLALIAAGMSMSPAQQQGKKDAPRPNFAEVRLGDGSLVRITILQENLDVMTRYGKLTVPFTEIRRIEFGLHLADGIGDKIDSAIKHLGSDVYRERDEASRELILMGGQAYPSLQRASRHPDLEVAQAATRLMKRIGEKVSAEQLRLKEDDVLQTSEFPVVGRIINSTIKVRSVHFGDIGAEVVGRAHFVRARRHQRGRHYCGRDPLRQRQRPVDGYGRHARFVAAACGHGRGPSGHLAARPRAIYLRAQGLHRSRQRGFLYVRHAAGPGRRERQSLRHRRTL